MRKPKAKNYERECEYCGSKFMASQSRAKYCSKSHKSLAYQTRHRRFEIRRLDGLKEEYRRLGLETTSEKQARLAELRRAYAKCWRQDATRER